MNVYIIIEHAYKKAFWEIIGSDPDSILQGVHEECNVLLI